jgi:hypothetical protein
MEKAIPESGCNLVLYQKEKSSIPLAQLSWRNTSICTKLNMCHGNVCWARNQNQSKYASVRWLSTALWAESLRLEGRILIPDLSFTVCVIWES